MYMASGLTRWGSVPAIMLFMRNPAHAAARIIYVEEDIDVPVESVFAAFEAQLVAEAGVTLAREANALLTVQWAVPERFAGLSAHRTVLTLTFESRADKTKLTLTHAGFGQGETWDEALDYFTQAWPSVVLQMKDALESARQVERLAA